MTGFTSRRALRAFLPFLLAWPLAASAHIQWFAQVDLSGDPRSPWDVMTAPSFLLLGLAAAAVLGAAGALDGWISRRAAAGAPWRAWIDFDLGDRTLTVLRFGLAACFVASILVVRDAPVILTPDLHTASPWTVMVQWGIAAALVTNFPRVAALGVLALFAQAVADYGPFHLMAYTVFVGIAVYLLQAGGGERARSRGLAVLRVTLGLTLMWGGIEKWLYPEWTYPLLCGSGKALLMGLSPDFFMQAAGFVEFCLAFVVVIGATAARVASALLALLMAAAIPMFGGVDAVGHAPFLLVLGLLAASRNPLAERLAALRPMSQAARWTTTFAATVGVLPVFYFAAHRAFYGRLALHRGASLMALVVPVAVALSIALLVRMAGRGADRNAGAA
jgi:hypothetical protein